MGNTPKADSSKIKELDGQIWRWQAAGWVFFALGIGIVAFSLSSLFDDNLQELAQYGDFIGGSVASLWALVGIIIIYIAFLKQTQQMIIQQEELELTREEMRDTRAELAGQHREMTKQNEIHEANRFNDIFFRYLTFYHNVIDGIDIDGSTGRAAIKKIHYDFIGSVNFSIQNIVPDETISYIQHKISSHIEYFLFLKILVQLIFLVYENEHINKYTYFNLLFSSVNSHEMVFLYYFITDSKISSDKLRDIVQDYGLFTQLQHDLLIKDEHVSLLNYRAFDSLGIRH